MLIGPTRLSARPFDPCVGVVRQVNKRLRNLTRSQIYDESRLILMGDGDWLNSWDFNIRQRIEWHHQSCSHNVAFMDGHVDFIHIRKGVHTTPRYLVNPFKSLLAQAYACQVEIPCG